MGSTLLVWFRSRNNALVIQEFMPESGIQQMQGRVLHTAIVPVDRQPVFKCFRTCQCLVIVRIGITQEIPGRSSPLRHCIGLTLCRTTTAWTSRIYPVGHCCKRRFSVVCRHITFYFRKKQRQLALIDRHIPTFIAVNNRNRLPPVTLTGEYPVS